MSEIKVMIVEDELIIAEDMKFMLQSMDYEVVGVAPSYSEAEHILENEQPDIALLDIVLNGDKDGIDIANLIKDKYQIPFIFITSHSDKATVQRAKEAQPNGYIVKPFEKENLFTAIEVAFSNYATMRENVDEPDQDDVKLIVDDSIFVRDRKQYDRVRFKDIIWVNADNNYIEIHTERKRYVLRKTLRDFVQMLPRNKFFRIHKSYVINLDHLKSIDTHFVIIDQDKKVPLSRSFRDVLLNKLQIL